MQKQLNITLLTERLEERGLTQTALASALGLTKAAVSKWLKGLSFPRPAELLKLGKHLELKYAELVEPAKLENEPLIAFRKRATCKTTEKHIAHAKDMGIFLEPLVEYLDFDKFISPPKLKNPSTDYAYLQALVKKLRRELDLADSAPINVEHMMKKFEEHQAVIVPAMWGKKDMHENALHIYLPKSETTWIYLNLDSEVHDFLFWMTHEFGHVLSVDLLERGLLDEAEDFADAFAGAMIFPEAAAKACFSHYEVSRSDSSRIDVLVSFAKTYVVSPYSVYKEIQKYADAQGMNFEECKQTALHQRIAIFKRAYATVSEILFKGDTPTADHFMRVAQEEYGTDFYKALGKYLNASKSPPSYIRKVTDVSLVDAQAFHEALVTT